MRHVMFFSQSLSTGGDDTVLLDILSHWPSRNDQLSMVLNSGHPGIDVYKSRLGTRAQIYILNEKTVPERKARIINSFSSSWMQKSRIAALQLKRLLEFLPSVLRLSRFIHRQKPQTLLLSSGGYPLSELSWRFLCAAKICGVPKIVLLVHNYPDPASSGIRSLYLRALGRIIPRLCDQVVTVSQHCADALAAYTGNRDIKCIHNGISLEPEPNLSSRHPQEASAERQNIERSAPAIEGKPLIGAIGHVEDRKGFKYLVMAMPRILKEFPNAKAALIGGIESENYVEELRRLIREKDIESQVILTGFLYDAWSLAEHFKILVIPSLYESFGMVALEAMRRKIPVVASAVGGLKEVISDGETGILTPARDADALAEAVLKLLRSPEKARQMGEKGHARLLEYFTTDKMARKYYELLSNHD